MALPKMKKKKKLFWQLWQCHCRKWKKKICFGNCGNGIAENVKKKKKKKIFLAIVAMPLPKMEKKNYENCE